MSLAETPSVSRSVIVKASSSSTSFRNYSTMHPFNSLHVIGGKQRELLGTTTTYYVEEGIKLFGFKMCRCLAAAPPMQLVPSTGGSGFQPSYLYTTTYSRHSTYEKKNGHRLVEVLIETSNLMMYSKA